MRFLEQETIPTGDNPRDFTRALCKRARQTIKAHARLSFVGIGVVLPGRVEHASGKLAFAPNLGWPSLDLKRSLQRATGLPVEIDNASNACALAEIWSGRHPESVRNLIAVTVSEGIGVGMILNGRLARGASGLAGEFGHVTIHEGGPLCKCGNRGCWEVYGSTAAAVRYFNELAAGRFRKPASTGFDALLRLAEKGDKDARITLDRMARYLGIGMAMLVTGLAPDVIVVCGEATRAWERIAPIIRDEMAKRHSPSHTRILPAETQTQPHLRGAAALVLQQRFGAPYGL